MRLFRLMQVPLYPYILEWPDRNRIEHAFHFFEEKIEGGKINGEAAMKAF